MTNLEHGRLPEGTGLGGADALEPHSRLHPSDAIPSAGPYSIGSHVWPGTSKIIEECGELMEVAGKLMGSGGDAAHWTGDLRNRLMEELADASSAIHFFAQANLRADEYEAFFHRAGVKGNRFWQWHVENGGFTRRFEVSSDSCVCGAPLFLASPGHNPRCSATAIAAGTRSAETSATSAQSEGCQSGGESRIAQVQSGQSHE